MGSMTVVAVLAKIHCESTSGRQVKGMTTAMVRHSFLSHTTVARSHSFHLWVLASYHKVVWAYTRRNTEQRFTSSYIA